MRSQRKEKKHLVCIKYACTHVRMHETHARMCIQEDVTNVSICTRTRIYARMHTNAYIKCKIMAHMYETGKHIYACTIYAGDNFFVKNSDNALSVSCIGKSKVVVLSWHSNRFKNKNHV